MQTSKKQVFLSLFTSFAFLFLGYQIYRLVSDDVSSAPATLQSSSTAPAVPHDYGREAIRTNQMVNTSQKIASLTTSSNAPAPLLKSQEEYLELVNEYELAKLRRQLLDEQAAIASAQHKIAVLNKQTNEISDENVSHTEINTISIHSSANAEPYRLGYLGKQDGHWSATLLKHGQYQQVEAGTLMPDGAQVLAVNNRGVTILQDKKHIMITFNGNVEIPDPPKVAVSTVLPTEPPAAKKSALAYAKSILRKQEIVLAHTPAVNKPKEIEPLNIARTMLKLPLPKIHYSKTEVKLLALNPQHYVIQLLGSYYLDVVDNFILANDLNKKVLEYSVKNDGENWHMLIMGDYNSLSAGETALEKLPEPLRIEHPWLRKAGNIQDDIRRAKLT